MISKGRAKLIYWAGPLFSWSEIYGNEILSGIIEKLSNGRYKFILPQRYSQEHPDSRNIRKQDLDLVRSADGLVANVDGPDVDSGTVVEIVTTQHQKKPVILVRTDPRVFYESIHINPMIIDENTKIVHVDALRQQHIIPDKLAQIILDVLDEVFNI